MIKKVEDVVPQIDVHSMVEAADFILLNGAALKDAYGGPVISDYEDPEKAKGAFISIDCADRFIISIPLKKFMRLMRERKSDKGEVFALITFGFKSDKTDMRDVHVCTWGSEKEVRKSFDQDNRPLYHDEWWLVKLVDRKVTSLEGEAVQIALVDADDLVLKPEENNGSS